MNKGVPVDVMPTWTADSRSIIFVRTLTTRGAKTTDLMTISRSGGEPELLNQVDDLPFSLFTPMFSLSDGSLLYALSPADYEDAGIWLLPPGGDAQQVRSGAVDEEIPMPAISDVVEHNGKVTIAGYSLVTMGQLPASSPFPSSFTLDLETGEVTPLESDDPSSQPGPTALSPDGGTTVSVLTGGGDGDQLMLVGARSSSWVTVTRWRHRRGSRVAPRSGARRTRCSFPVARPIRTW